MYGGVKRMAQNKKIIVRNRKAKDENKTRPGERVKQLGIPEKTEGGKTMKFRKVNDQIVISATPVGEEIVANMVDAFHLKKRILSILIVCAMLLAAVIPASADEKEEYLTFIKMRYKYSFDGDEIEYSNITEEDNNYKGEGGGNSGGVYYSGFRIPEEEYIKSGEYYYRKLEDGTIALLAIDLSRQLETLTIPSTIDGLTVTRIGIDAITGTRINDQDFLADCVKKVILPDTIKIVGPGIFDNSMKEITFPDGVEEIGAINRFGNRSVKKVTLPKKSLKVLADFALAGTADNSIVVPDGVVEIGFAAFLRSQVKSVTIPASVEKLGDFIFLTCSRLSSVTLKDGVPYIAKGMFYRCEKLGSIKLGESAPC